MFSRKTFEYFEGAKKNRRNLKWFARNRHAYEENVRLPFSLLIRELKEQVGPLFPEIGFHSQRICLPVYRENLPDDGTLVKPFTWAFFSEKRSSLFEWNPGINLYFGDELALGIGLYHPSSRQMKLLRDHISSEPDRLRKILQNKKLTSTWGELVGEKYKRFPVGYSPDSNGAAYLWNKQFVMKRNLTRKEFLSPHLSDLLTTELVVGAPFLHWLQETVGVYEKKLTL